MVEKWGKSVTDQLWDTSFTWGDVMRHDGGASMLVLFELDDTNRYYGGFWGVEGDTRGTVTSYTRMLSSQSASKDVLLTEQYRNWRESLPNRINSSYRYDFYPTTYVQLGKIQTTGVSASIATRGASLAEKFGFIKPLSKVAGRFLGAIGLAGDVITVASFADEVAGTNHLGNTRTLYPVLRAERPYGIGPVWFPKWSAPRGYYDH